MNCFCRVIAVFGISLATIIINDVNGVNSRLIGSRIFVKFGGTGGLRIF